MTPLSVIVANTSPDPARGGRAVSALLEQLAPCDELVWADSAGVDPPPVSAIVRAPHGAPRGELYARALALAGAELVAMTDSTSMVRPGWRTAAVSGLERADVVGGPVFSAPNPDRLTTAGFFVEYGPHSAPPYLSASGDVAANNVAYRRAALDAVLTPHEQVWKSVVNERLRARGSAPALVVEMQVESLKTYSWSDLLAHRAAHGRLYASQRAVGWTVPQRAVAAAACAALPLLSYWRLAHRMGQDRAQMAKLVAVTPLVLAAQVMWSAGEALGYIAGPARGTHVF